MQAADNTVGALQRQESELQLIKKIIGVYSRRMKALTGTTTQIHYGDCSEDCCAQSLITLELCLSCYLFVGYMQHFVLGSCVRVKAS